MRHNIAALIILGLIGCSPDVPKKVPVEPVKQGNKDLSVKEPQKVEFNPAVDILFVIDDSGSMEYHQKNLAKNVDQFVAAISKNSVLDWHIGVVTTDMKDSDRKGKLYGFPKYVTKSTTDMIDTLKHHLQPGISGDSTEKGFDPVMEAFGTHVNGYNAGFYRPNAHLVLIYITDAEEQSKINPQDFYDWLLKLKNGDKEKMMIYGVVSPPGSSCSKDETGKDPLRYMQLFELAAAPWFSLCDTNFGTNIASIGIDVSKKISQVIYLASRPMLGTIVVKFGSKVIPNHPTQGWVYFPDKNIIEIGSDVDLSGEPEGTKIEVEYMAQAYD